MSETHRFLRYVMPGLLFAAETLLLLWILLPGWTEEQLSVLAKADATALGVVLGAFLLSGGLGFLFSVIHHTVHWRETFLRFGPFGPNVLNHQLLITSLIDRGLLNLRDGRTGAVVNNGLEPPMTRAEAWVVTNSLFHRSAQEDTYAAVNRKAGSFTDLTHAMGTGMVATAFAAIVTVAVLSRVSVLTADGEARLRFGIAVFVVGALLWLFWKSYRRTGELAAGFINHVLTDALAENAGPRRGEGPTPRVTHVPIMSVREPS